MMTEATIPDTLSPQELELLEWVRGACGGKFSLIIEAHDGSFTVKLLDYAAAAGRTGTGQTFDDAWTQVQPDSARPALTVIQGGRDGER